MRKLYSLFAMMLLAALGMSASAATAQVYIDNKTNVYLYTNGDNYDRVEPQLVNGEYVTISFTEGLTWNLDGNNVTFYQLVRNGEVLASNFKPVFDEGFDFEVSDGDIIEIFVNAPTSGNAVAKVYVDEISYSLFIYDSADKDWIDVTSQLTAGKTANIEFNPATQSMWNIEGAGTFYLIEKDGQALLENSSLPGGEMDIYGMTNGSELNIYVKNPNPQEKATITVDYGQYGEEAVKYMTVDGEDVEVVDGKFEANKGSQLLVFTDNRLYDIASVTLGETALAYVIASGCYVGTIDGDATLSIVAEPKAPAQITLSVNQAEAVTVYMAQNAYFLNTENEVAIVEGANTLLVEPAYPVVQVVVGDAYTVVAATYTDKDGNVADMSYDSWGKFYSVDVMAKNVASINIETEDKVVTYVTFGVEIEDVNVFSGYFIRTNNPREFICDSDDPAKLLHNGLNEFTITSEQAASVRFNFEFVGEAITDITIDGVSAGLKYDDYDNSVWGDVKIENGQIMKVGDFSGIQSVGNDAQAGKVYNMQGMEVKGAQLPAGIYIINGKKTLVK